MSEFKAVFTAVDHRHVCELCNNAYSKHDLGEGTGDGPICPEPKTAPFKYTVEVSEVHKAIYFVESDEPLTRKELVGKAHIVIGGGQEEGVREQEDGILEYSHTLDDSEWTTRTEEGDFVRDNLTKQPAGDVTIAETVANGELDLDDGMTIDEIIEQCGRNLDSANSVGQVVFKGSDGKYYTVTVEAMIGECSAAFLTDVLSEVENNLST